MGTSDSVDRGWADPGAIRPTVPRPRLLDPLARRFEVRLTVVTGGGGSGKSTLLAQAREDPGDHLDIFHACQAADREEGRLTSRLVAGAVAGAENLVEREALAGPAADLERLGELVLAMAPRQVCVMLDDLHLLGASTVVGRLLDVLPANGHLLVAGRRRTTLNRARLEMIGELVELEQDDLLMTEEEQIDFANLRGVDVDLLAAAEGWPAFIELASGGTKARSRQYLKEEAVAALDDDRRRALAAFAFVGGGDDDLCRAATGLGLDELLGDLPLVRRQGSAAVLHDLWSELLVGELATDTRVNAVRAATSYHRSEGSYDRAIDVALLVDARDDVAVTIEAALVDGVDGGIRSERLRRWREALTADDAVAGLGLLLTALIEREEDLTAASTADSFERAASTLHDENNPALLLVALNQLGYIVQITEAADRLGLLHEQLDELAAHYAPARPFRAIGQAWTAFTSGQADRTVSILGDMQDTDLPPMWTATRDHLLAHGYLASGHAHEALQVVPRDMDTARVPIPGALITESQCQWHAGHPHVARSDPPMGRSDRHGARDRFLAGAWLGFMHAFAGDSAAARQALNDASEHVGELPALVVTAQVEGVDILIDLAEGNEDVAAERIAGILELVPLDGGVGEQLFRNVFVLPYVTVRSSRDFWDRFGFGPVTADILPVAQAFVAVREQGTTARLETVELPEPAMLAAYFPVRWAVELALHCVRIGRQEGHRYVAWLCEHWGTPARVALRSWTDDNVLAKASTELLARTPLPPPTPVELRVLGQTTVLLDGHASRDPDWNRERVRALIVLLVLHGSMTRDRIAGVLWPDLSIDRAQKNLRTTLNYLHRVLEPRRAPRDATWFVRTEGQEVELHHSLGVDLFGVRDALDEADSAERQGRPNLALERTEQALSSWGGDLAADLDYEWLDLERIHLRSRFVRASCRVAELMVATGRPDEAIDVAQSALAADPWHDRSHEALAAAYDALGDSTSAQAVRARAAKQLGGLAVP